MASVDYPGRLNVFQRAMLQWNDMHPYHAVHVMRLPGMPEPARIRQAITARLRACGLSGLRLDREGGRFCFDAAPPALEIRTITGGNDPVDSLSGEIEGQLNRRFEIHDRFTPFRFFLLAQKGSFLLGVTYFHPIADAQSVAFVMRELAADYITGRPAEAVRALDCHPPRHDRLLPSHPEIAIRRLLSLPRDIRTIRRAYRAPLRHAHDPGNRVKVGAVHGATLKAMRETAHAWGITLHDLLLAVLINALSALAPDRLRQSRRRDVAVGSIVNTRRDHGIDSEGTFGLYLGTFIVSHPAPGGLGLAELAMDIHRQTRGIKERKLYLATALDLSLAQRLLALYSSARRRTFYHKFHPLWAGVTNMNMNPIWQKQPDARPLDYLRAVSTGPITPLVLCASTFGDKLNIALTYRPAVFDDAEIERVMAELTRQLEELEVRH